MQDCPIGSTLLQVYFRIQMPLFTRFYLGRPGRLWPTRATLADQVHFGRSSPLWSISSTLADQVRVGRSGPLRPIWSTSLRSTWPSDFVISSGDARPSHRIDFTSGLLQDPDASFHQVIPWPTSSTLADQVYFSRPGPLWPIRSTLADQIHFGPGPL